MEISAPGAALQSATLCMQMVFVTPHLAIIKTETTKEAWRTHMDDMMQEDPSDVVLRIKQKTSWLGGRPGQIRVTPSATQNQLSAARRTKANAINHPQPQHMVANISIGGTIGWDPQAVITHLMQMVGQFSRLPLQDASLRQDIPPLSWRWLAATDPSAPPGRIRLQLETLEQVQLIISHIHGRSLQFGSDLVAIEIQNDLLDAHQARSGNQIGGLQ